MGLTINTTHFGSIWQQHSVALPIYTLRDYQMPSSASWADLFAISDCYCGRRSSWCLRGHCASSFAIFRCLTFSLGFQRLSKSYSSSFSECDWQCGAFAFGEFVWIGFGRSWVWGLLNVCTLTSFIATRLIAKFSSSDYQQTYLVNSQNAARSYLSHWQPSTTPY